MIEISRLISILGAVLSTSTSINVLVIIYLLGEYVVLDREERPSPEKQHYIHATILLLIVFYLGASSLILLLILVIFDVWVALNIVVILFVTQIVLLIGGLTWICYQILR